MDINQLSSKETKWLTSITQYINNVYVCASSKTNPTPLLADGFDPNSAEVVHWLYADNRRAPIANFASQQNFLRLLYATSIVTGDHQYQKKSQQITRYFLDNFTDHTSGLFYWGGHRFINLDTLETEGPANKSQVHELKNHLPFYDLLYQTDKEKTLNYIKALWNAHINDWQTLDMSRHGDYNKPFDPNVFCHQRYDVVDPNNWPNLPKTIGLTFINAGTDLIYAAYKYAQYTKDENAQAWAKHLYRQYILARCPLTGMPVYQYSSPLQREPIPFDDNKTESWYGDRAARQFGPEFGEIAIEANVLFRDMSPMDMWPLLMDNPLAILSVMKQSPDTEVIDWVIKGLKNYYTRAYDADTNTLRPMWGNGIDMTGYVFKRDGYYGKRGTILEPIKLRPDYLLPLIQAWDLSEDKELEQLIIHMLANLKLVEFGDDFAELKQINLTNNLSQPNLIFALIELNSKLANNELNKLIEHLADNLFNHHTRDDFFVESLQHRFVRIDNSYPLALLAVIAAKQHQTIPIPLSKGGYIHGEYLIDNELQTIYDVNHIYQQLI